ncbi:MAG: hypothetical protein ACRDZ8_17560 [Acidimicrobiales bacterium]
MDLATIDRHLAQLRTTVDAMSTNLVDLENDPTRTRLDQAALTGTTAEQWAQAKANLTSLWSWFSLLNDTIQHATTLRGTKGRLDPATLAQLDAMVNGPSITLATADIPLSQRGLYGPSEAVVRCSPEELLGRMRQAFDQVVGVMTASNRTWSTVEARVSPLEATLLDTQRLDDQSGSRHRSLLDRVRAQLSACRQAANADPLATTQPALDGVEASLASVSDDLKRTLELKDTLALRIREARTLLSQVHATAAAAGQAGNEALAKIVAPAVLDPPTTGALGEELERVASLCAQGEWQPANNVLVQWTSRCRDALAAAQRALSANQTPLATRNELRGRLDGYRGKAYRLGLLENPRVAGLYAQAHQALSTAPTDLEAAAALVRRYQEALAGPAPTEVAR